MKTTTKLLPLLFAASMLYGCASHHMLASPVPMLSEAGLISDPKQASQLEQAMTDKEIAKLLDLDVHAKLPTRLAVAKLVTSYRGNPPDMEQVSAEELTAWKNIIPDKKYITGVQAISILATDAESQQRGKILHNLRVAAAKMRCELLLVYVQADTQVDNFNDAAALYWTFVGLWLVPGNVLEHRTVMQAIFVDCRTGAILGTAIGDTHIKRIAPAALSAITRDKLNSEAPKRTLADLQNACKRVLAEIVNRAVKQSKKPSKTN